MATALKATMVLDELSGAMQLCSNLLGFLSPAANIDFLGRRLKTFTPIWWSRMQLFGRTGPVFPQWQLL